MLIIIKNNYSNWNIATLRFTCIIILIAKKNTRRVSGAESSRQLVMFSVGQNEYLSPYCIASGPNICVA